MTIKSVFLLLSLLPLHFLTQTVEAEEQTQTQQKTVTFDVQNMTCTLCQYTIKKALKGVEGVVEVDVDFTAKTVTVRFNSAITKVDALINATTNAGYPTTIFLQ